VKLRFGTLCDYAGDGANGKLLIVNVFDTVWDNLKVRPVPFPPCYLVALFEASIVEGSQRPLTVRFQTADGNDVLPPVTIPLRLVPQGPGRLSKGNLAIGLMPFSVPDLGEYVFAFYSDQDQLGTVDVYVQEPLIPQTLGSPNP
jgi:hypothetical protein